MPVSNDVVGLYVGSTPLLTGGGGSLELPPVTDNLHWWFNPLLVLPGASFDASTPRWISIGAEGHAKQSTASKQPIYREDVIGGQPAVQFDGVDDRLLTSLSEIPQPYTICAVVQVVTVPTGFDRQIVAGSADGSPKVFAYGDYGWRMEAGSMLSTGVNIDTNPHLLVARFDGASSSFRIDGVEEATGDAGTTALKGVALGAAGSSENYFLDGHIGEVLVYGGISSTDLDSVETWLMDRWGL